MLLGTGFQVKVLNESLNAEARKCSAQVCDMSVRGYWNELVPRDGAMIPKGDVLAFKDPVLSDPETTTRVRKVSRSSVSDFNLQYDYIK